MKRFSIILCLWFAFLGCLGCTVGKEGQAPESPLIPTLTSTPEVVSTDVVVEEEGQAPGPPPIPTLTSTPEAVSTEVVKFSQEEIRDLGLAYWDAFNSYDLDRLLSYLEPVYVELRRDILAQELGQMRSFNVKLGVTVLVDPEDVTSCGHRP